MYIRRIAAAVVALTSALAAAAGDAGHAEAGSRSLTPFITPTPLSACGAITAPGSYVLTANPPPVPGTCFAVRAPHVTLDLAGHTVAGMGTGAGVFLLATAVDAKIESTVPGGAVGGFAVGIRDNASGAAIDGPGILVADNRVDGVWVYHTRVSYVVKVTVRGKADYGIHVQSSGSAVLQFDQVAASKIYGIWVQSSRGTQVIGNNVVGSGTAGTYLGCSGTANLQNISCGPPTQKSQIRKNILLNNGNYGIAIADASVGNTIVGNQVSGDKVKDLYDENFHCAWSTGTNSWQSNTGTPNQTSSATCIG